MVSDGGWRVGRVCVCMRPTMLSVTDAIFTEMQTLILPTSPLISCLTRGVSQYYVYDTSLGTVQIFALKNAKQYFRKSIQMLTEAPINVCLF